MNLTKTEKVSFGIWDSGNNKEYPVVKTMTLEMGETYGSSEALVKFDGVVPAERPVLRSITAAPFSFRFNTEPNRDYSIEGSVDLKVWEALEKFKST